MVLLQGDYRIFNGPNVMLLLPGDYRIFNGQMLCCYYRVTTGYLMVKCYVAITGRLLDI